MAWNNPQEQQIKDYERKIKMAERSFKQTQKTAADSSKLVNQYERQKKDLEKAYRHLEQQRQKMEFAERHDRVAEANSRALKIRHEENKIAHQERDFRRTELLRSRIAAGGGEGWLAEKARRREQELETLKAQKDQLASTPPQPYYDPEGNIVYPTQAAPAKKSFWSRLRDAIFGPRAQQ